MNRYRAAQRRVLRLLVGSAVTAGLLASMASMALAAPGFEITIPVDSIVRIPDGEPVGWETLVGSADVGSEFQGQECAVRAIAENQESVHPNNNLIVRSGSSEVVVPDVENTPNQVIEGDGTLVLGSSIQVFVQIGADRVFSAGFDVIVDCTPLPPSGWACVEGDVVFIEDASGFDGTLYDTEEEAAADPECAEVAASTTFAIGGACNVVDGVVTFTISGDLGEGLALDVAGQTVDEAGEFSIQVGSAGDFAYEVTVDEGFALADGSPPAADTISIEDCTPPPPSGWACVQGEVVFVEDATGFEGTLYDTEEAAESAPGCNEEVLASIVVDVDSSCDVVDGDGQGQIEVSVSVEGGATVVIRDSDGDVVASVTDDATIVVEEGATYTWEATPNEGFEFPPGSATSGTITIETCTDVLPFTGPNTELLVAVGVGLLGAGAAVLASERRREEQS